MASTVDLLPHAVVRCSQRGFSLSDIELAQLLGVEVEGGLFVRERDAREAARLARRFAARAERLAGTRLVFAEGHLITAYHASPTKQRNLLRRSAERDMEG